jgi:hypothetical protein
LTASISPWYEVLNARSTAVIFTLAGPLDLSRGPDVVIVAGCRGSGVCIGLQAPNRFMR